MDDEFYSLLFGLNNVPIPSKRQRFRKDEQGKVTLFERQIARVFEERMKLFFGGGRGPAWPCDGPVFLALDVALPRGEFHSKDIDNLAKAVLDALKGIIYRDDGQVVSVFVGKRVGPEYSLMVGVKRLEPGGEHWFVPEVRTAGRFMAE